MRESARLAGAHATSGRAQFSKRASGALTLSSTAATEVEGPLRPTAGCTSRPGGSPVPALLRCVVASPPASSTKPTNTRDEARERFDILARSPRSAAKRLVPFSTTPASLRASYSSILYSTSFDAIQTDRLCAQPADPTTTQHILRPGPDPCAFVPSLPELVIRDLRYC